MTPKTLLDKLKVLENLAEKFQKADKELKEKDSVAYDKKWRDYFKHEAEALQKKSEERKKLYESIQMSDEKSRRRFTI